MPNPNLWESSCRVNGSTSQPTHYTYVDSGEPPSHTPNYFPEKVAGVLPTEDWPCRLNSSTGGWLHSEHDAVGWSWLTGSLPDNTDARHPVCPPYSSLGPTRLLPLSAVPPQRPWPPSARCPANSSAFTPSPPRVLHDPLARRVLKACLSKRGSQRTRRGKRQRQPNKPNRTHKRNKPHQRPRRAAREKCEDATEARRAGTSQVNRFEAPKGRAAVQPGGQFPVVPRQRTLGAVTGIQICPHIQMLQLAAGHPIHGIVQQQDGMQKREKGTNRPLSPTPGAASASVSNDSQEIIRAQFRAGDFVPCAAATYSQPSVDCVGVPATSPATGGHPALRRFPSPFTSSTSPASSWSSSQQASSRSSRVPPIVVVPRVRKLVYCTLCCSKHSSTSPTCTHASSSSPLSGSSVSCLCCSAPSPCSRNSLSSLIPSAASCGHALRERARHQGVSGCPSSAINISPSLKASTAGKADCRAASFSCCLSSFSSCLFSCACALCAADATPQSTLYNVSNCTRPNTKLGHCESRPCTAAAIPSSSSSSLSTASQTQSNETPTTVPGLFNPPHLLAASSSRSNSDYSFSATASLSSCMSACLEDFVLRLFRLNSVANSTRKGRDDFDVQTLRQAKKIYRKTSEGT
eukprot:GHVT01101235.1.p1 GENE.GHVT01101235.1~~GHVT01101235.1.p1  ORF type:complete len:650 (+),score=75.28 GHVT01101235.1:52-1950(+)